MTSSVHGVQSSACRRILLVVFVAVMASQRTDATAVMQDQSVARNISEYRSPGTCAFQTWSNSSYVSAPVVIPLGCGIPVSGAFFLANATATNSSIRSAVPVWKSIVPPSIHMTSDSAYAGWVQSNTFPDDVVSPFTTSLTDPYSLLVQWCYVNCSSLYPASTSVYVFLAYDQCYCTASNVVGPATPISSLMSTSLACCVRLPCGGSEQPSCTNNSNLVSLVPKPTSCAPNQVYGELLLVRFPCALNPAYCSNSCEMVDGCCVALGSTTPVPANSPPSADSTPAAQWLVSLLLVAVALQLGYWILRLRLCRSRNAAENVQIRLPERPTTEMELVAQLNGIAAMRLALLRRRAALAAAAEPRRSKEEAQEAAAEAIALLTLCNSSEIDADECCPMCLDGLATQACVRVLCGHTIHQACMSEFLAHKLVSYRTSITCPMCRAVVLVQNEVQPSTTVSENLLNDVEAPLLREPTNSDVRLDPHPLPMHLRVALLVQESEAVEEVERIMGERQLQGRRSRASSRGRRFTRADSNSESRIVTINDL